MDILNYFVSLAALIPLIVLITDFLIRWLKIEKGWLKQVISWVISVILCAVGVFFDIGMFAGLSLTYAVIYGFAAGLVANGVFDIKIVQMLLDFLLKFLPKKE